MSDFIGDQHLAWWPAWQPNPTQTSKPVQMDRRITSGTSGTNSTRENLLETLNDAKKNLDGKLTLTPVENFCKIITELLLRLLSPGTKVASPYGFFIFIGLQGSGKSTAIKNIFGISGDLDEPESLENFHLLTLRNRNVKGNGKHIYVLECPGLASYVSPEKNTATISSLSKCLENNQSAPKFVFITARLNDHRFQGEFSEFTQSLHTISKIERLASDTQWMNLILVFTYGDRPNVRNSDIKLIVCKYEDTVRTVFGRKPLHKIVLHHEGYNSDIMQFIQTERWEIVDQGTFEDISDKVLPVEDITKVVSNAVVCKT